MPRASKRKLSSDLSGELLTNFTDLISSLQNASEINEFINTFLTREEKIMVSKRLMLYIMFERKYKTAEIAILLGMSKVTVNYHRNKWLLKNKSFKLMLHKLIRRNRVNKIWEKVEDTLYPLDLMMQSKSSMKARAKLYSGDFRRNK